VIIKPKNTLVLVNLDANNGRAKSKWISIKDKFYNLLGGEPHTILYHTPCDLRDLLTAKIKEEKIEFLISAGGDGSLNYLVNHLMTIPSDTRKNLMIGAIGLGSSNDSLKPFRQQIHGVPVNLNPDLATFVDIGHVVLGSDSQNPHYFINNVSFGVTADANNLFNEKDLVIRLTKRFFTNLSIIYAAIKTIVLHKNIPFEISYDNNQLSSELSSLSIIKTPYLAGILKYDQTIERNDAKLGVNLCENMTRFELVKTVIALSRSKFTGRPKCKSFKAEKITLHFPEIVNIEIDGEVKSDSSFEISLNPKAINFIFSTPKPK